MKADTEVWLGIRHVGKKDHVDEIVSGPLAEQLKRLTKFMLTTSMATRFEFSLARTKEEIIEAFSRRDGNVTGKKKSAANESIMSELEKMLEDMGGID